MGFSEHIDTILNRTELTRELLRKIQGLESRRDQEEGGGAGLRKLDYTLLQLLLKCCATDIVFVTQLRTAVETANSEVHELPRSAKVLTTVTFLEDELRPLYRCPDYNEVQIKYLRPVVDNDVEPSLKYVFNNPNIYANRKALCVHVLYVIFMTIQCEIIKNTQNDVHRPSTHQ